MPTVPRYGGRQVDTAPLPGVRKQAAETDLSSGVGLEHAKAQKAQTIGAFGGQIAHISIEQVGRLQQQERDRADDVAFMAGQARLGKWKIDRVYDPEKGALAQKGEAALGLPEQIDAEFLAVNAEIEGKLNARQREKWARYRNDSQLELHGTIQRHVFGEMQEFERDKLAAVLETGESLAIAQAMDPRAVEVELGGMIAALTKSGPRLGMGADELKAEAAKIASRVHVGVIKRLLTDKTTFANGKLAAAVYFEEKKGEIRGEALEQIEGALKMSTVLADAQDATAKILGAGGTLTEQRAAADQIANREVRDEVKQRLEHERTVRDRETREVKEQQVRHAYDIVDQTHDVNAISAVEWAALDGGTRSAIRDYSESLAAGVKQASDPGTYYNLMTAAATHPEDFQRTNLLAYRPHLDAPDWERLVGLQKNMRDGAREKTEKAIEPFRTHAQLIDNTLTNYGIDPNAKEGTPAATAKAQLLRQLELKVAASSVPGKPGPSNDEIQQMLDRLMVGSKKTPGSWWALVNPIAYDWKDKKGRALIESTIDDVPPAHRAAIAKVLQADGRPVTDATILEHYIEVSTRGR